MPSSLQCGAPDQNPVRTYHVTFTGVYSVRETLYGDPFHRHLSNAALAVVVATVNLLREAKVRDADSHVISQPTERDRVSSCPQRPQRQSLKSQVCTRCSWKHSRWVTKRERPHSLRGSCFGTNGRASEGEPHELYLSTLLVCVAIWTNQGTWAQRTESPAGTEVHGSRKSSSSKPGPPGGLI